MVKPSDLEKMEEGFGLDEAVAEAQRCLLCHAAPRSNGCPAGTDPGSFIRKLRLRNQCSVRQITGHHTRKSFRRASR